jgi:hypothetical protein
LLTLQIDIPQPPDPNSQYIQLSLTTGSTQVPFQRDESSNPKFHPIGSAHDTTNNFVESREMGVNFWRLAEACK